MRVTFKEWDCIAEGHFYLNGSKAIKLIDKDDHSPVATATVNVVEEKLPEDLIFIKDYSENTGMVKALTMAGIIIPKEIHTVQSGHVWISAYKLTETALNQLW